jgi:hypothetical protein
MVLGELRAWETKKMSSNDPKPNPDLGEAENLCVQPIVYLTEKRRCVQTLVPVTVH